MHTYPLYLYLLSYCHRRVNEEKISFACVVQYSFICHWQCCIQLYTIAYIIYHFIILYVDNSRIYATDTQIQLRKVTKLKLQSNCYKMLCWHGYTLKTKTIIVRFLGNMFKNENFHISIVC